MDARHAENLYLTGYGDAKTVCLTLGPADAHAWLRENPAEPGGDPYRAGWVQSLADHLDANGLPPVSIVSPPIREQRQWA